MGRFLRDNALSLAFLLLFAVCLIGQVLAGYALQSGDPLGQPQPTGYLAYLRDPTFLKGVFSNWQAALLQLLALILLTVFLRQKGAAHSRKTDGEPAQDPRERRLRWFGRHRSWVYSNSLSLAFMALFLASSIGFVVSERAVYNAERGRHGEAAVDWAGFLLSADLWFATFQTWQAEFFAMAVFLILSVFLRQEDSAESKPVGAGDGDTGETNE